MKSLNTKGFRKITVAGSIYLWKRNHHHPKEYKHQQCVEKVLIYLIDHKKSPLQLIFKDDNENSTWCVGYPNSGVLWNNVTDINFNRPGVIATLITHFLANGWNPEVDQKPLVIANEKALKLLETITFPEEIIH